MMKIIAFLFCLIFVYPIASDSVESYLAKYFKERTGRGALQDVAGADVFDWSHAKGSTIPIPMAGNGEYYKVAIPFGGAIAYVRFTVITEEDTEREWKLHIPRYEGAEGRVSEGTSTVYIEEKWSSVWKAWSPHHAEIAFVGAGNLDINPLPENAVKYLGSFWINMFKKFGVSYAMTTDDATVKVHGLVPEKDVHLMFVRAFAGKMSAYVKPYFYKANSYEDGTGEDDETRRMSTRQIVDALRNTPLADISAKLSVAESNQANAALAAANLLGPQRTALGITTIGQLMTKLWYGDVVANDNPALWNKVYQPQWYAVWKAIKRNAAIAKYIDALPIRYRSMKMPRPKIGWWVVLRQLPSEFTLIQRHSARIEEANQYEEKENQEKLKNRLYALQQMFEKSRLKHHQN